LNVRPSFFNLEGGKRRKPLHLIFIKEEREGGWQHLPYPVTLLEEGKKEGMPTSFYHRRRSVARFDVLQISILFWGERMNFL